MRILVVIIITSLFHLDAIGQVRTIHAFVALCDNQFQGIVPVHEKLGNGKDPSNNLYWGAACGVKSFLKYKTNNWRLLKTTQAENSIILERLIFKHVKEEIYLLADAYDGEKIKECIEDFLLASNSQNPINVKINSLALEFGGHSDLIAFIGHDGLMDFDVNIKYSSSVKKIRDVIILACYSKDYFSAEIKKSKANPILWTTHLMAPEAYTLKAAIDGWILNESGTQIEERAAQIYNKYQKCGIKGARNLFTTGF